MLRCDEILLPAAPAAVLQSELSKRLKEHFTVHRSKTIFLRYQTEVIRIDVLTRLDDIQVS